MYNIFGISTRGVEGDKLRDMEGNLVNPSDLLWDEVSRISQNPGLLRMGSVHHGWFIRLCTRTWSVLATKRSPWKGSSGRSLTALAILRWEITNNSITGVINTNIIINHLRHHIVLAGAWWRITTIIDWLRLWFLTHLLLFCNIVLMFLMVIGIIVTSAYHFTRSWCPCGAL